MKIIIKIIIISTFSFFADNFSQTWPFGSNASSITSSFGSRKIYDSNLQINRYDFHEGIDIPAPKPTIIKGVKAGIVRDFGVPSNTKNEWVLVENYNGID